MRTLDGPARSLVTIPTELSWLLNKVNRWTHSEGPRTLLRNQFLLRLLWRNTVCSQKTPSAACRYLQQSRKTSDNDRCPQGRCPLIVRYQQQLAFLAAGIGQACRQPKRWFTDQIGAKRKPMSLVRLDHPAQKTQLECENSALWTASRKAGR